jgi:hypothetical protein
MNNIYDQISESDRIDARRQRRNQATIARSILDNLANASIHSCTFADFIPINKREQAEAYFKNRFELWANTWVAPLCREIIAKQK